MENYKIDYKKEIPKIIVLMMSIVVFATCVFVGGLYVVEGSLDGVEWERLLKIIGLVGALLVFGTMIMVPLAAPLLRLYERYPKQFEISLVVLGILLIAAALAGYDTLFLGIFAIIVGTYPMAGRRSPKGRHPEPDDKD